jgi:chorismate--pyruvate lyase
MPLFWQDWLATKGSLTRRLVTASAGDFRVRVLHQAVGLPAFSEQRVLRLPDRRWALIREVVLYGRGEPWVYARSILPLRTLTGRLRRFRRLDERPLGDLLFRYPSMRRGPVAVARVDGAHLPAGLAPAGTFLWGRRSVFRVDDKPLLVGEVFLPAFAPAG